MTLKEEKHKQQRQLGPVKIFSHSVVDSFKKILLIHNKIRAQHILRAQ